MDCTRLSVNWPGMAIWTFLQTFYAHIVPDYAWIVQDSFVFALCATGTHVYCPGMVQDCTGFICVRTLHYGRTHLLSRNGTGLYRIRFRNDFKGLKLGYIDPESLHIVQDYFVSLYICMCTPELSWIGDILQDCTIFLLLLATFELHCKGFVLLNQEWYFVLCFYYFWQPLSCIVKDLYYLTRNDILYYVFTTFGNL